MNDELRTKQIEKLIRIVSIQTRNITVLRERIQDLERRVGVLELVDEKMTDCVGETTH